MRTNLRVSTIFEDTDLECDGAVYTPAMAIRDYCGGVPRFLRLNGKLLSESDLPVPIEQLGALRYPATNVLIVIPKNVLGFAIDMEDEK